MNTVDSSADRLPAARRAPPRSVTRLRSWLRRPPKGTLVAISLLAVFHVVLFFQFTQPDRGMPSLLQRLVAVADAALVASVAQFTFDGWGLRRRRVRWFGARRGIRVATILSAAIFMAVAAIWCSSWAPIKPLPDAARSEARAK